uniref:DOMON domain-containing protein n=1 Tax=Meloidogyne javanica TaxID=6303 RepID=A0A915N8N4_MELJA
MFLFSNFLILFQFSFLFYSVITIKEENENLTNKGDLSQFDSSGCGLTKGCLFKPPNCNPYNDCSYALSYISDDERVYFELLAQVAGESNVWAAVGFSVDGLMGGDTVTDCSSLEGRDYKARLSYNPGKSNRKAPLAYGLESKILHTHHAKVADGIIYCRFSQLIQPPESVQPQFVRPLNAPIFILLASGVTRGKAIAISLACLKFEQFFIDSFLARDVLIASLGAVIREGAPKQITPPRPRQPALLPSAPPQLQRQPVTPPPMYNPGLARTQSSPSSITPPIVFVPVHPAPAAFLPPPPPNNVPPPKEPSIRKPSPVQAPPQDSPSAPPSSTPIVPPDSIVIHPLPPLGGKGRLNKKKKKKKRDTTSSSSSSDSTVETETEGTQDDDGGILLTSPMKKGKKRRKKHKHKKRHSKKRKR